MWPFRKKPKLELLDPEFGRIEYGRGSWCAIPQLGGTSEFMIGIHADEKGPSDLQRNFYREICSDLARLKEVGLAFVKREAFVPVDIGTLEVYSVGIGSEVDCKNRKFDLEFADEQADLIHVVWFDQGKPVIYGCDD
jgi:hypothetical protein